MFLKISELLLTIEIVGLMMEAKCSETSNLSARKRAHGLFERGVQEGINSHDTTELQRRPIGRVAPLPRYFI